MRRGCCAMAMMKWTNCITRFHIRGTNSVRMLCSILCLFYQVSVTSTLCQGPSSVTVDKSTSELYSGITEPYVVVQWRTEHAQCGTVDRQSCTVDVRSRTEPEVRLIAKTAAAAANNQIYVKLLSAREGIVYINTNQIYLLSRQQIHFTRLTSKYSLSNKNSNTETSIF